MAGLKPRYINCRPQGIKSDQLVYRSALWLKRLHRKWGAPLIRLKLQQRYPERKVPTERTMHKWFRKAGLTAPRSKTPKEGKQWALRPHGVWQVDGKEEQRLATGEWACWLTIVDEHSGALLAGPAFQKKGCTMYLSKMCRLF